MKGEKRIVVPIKGEWIGDQLNGKESARLRKVSLLCQSSTEADLPDGSLDAVFTDPPYFGNVQYAELMDFCYVWVKRLADVANPTFASHTTRNVDELTGNVTMERGFDHFTDGLSAAFCKMAKALKPGRPMAFTYHHNRIDAYYPVTVAILDAGLSCSAALPCPAEMGASIHISGTGSSIVDTVFVCRSTGVVSRRSLANTLEEFADLVTDDLDKLRLGGLKPTRGDVRCIIIGHLTRMSVWHLRSGWNKVLSTDEKLGIVAKHFASLPQPEEIEDVVSVADFPVTRFAVNEDAIPYDLGTEDVMF